MECYPDIYRNIFKVATIESMPNPFVISTKYPSDVEYKSGCELVFYITLFGAVCGFAQKVANAVESMNNGKLANTRLMRCEEIYDQEWSDAGAEHISHCDVLTVDFLTPTGIMVKKQATAQIDFHLFVDRLFARIGEIIDNYSDSELVIPYNLVSKKPNVKAEYNLRMVKFQTNGQPISGVCGKVRYMGNVSRYLPYIDLASQLHIGKKTTRSCGEFSFEI